MVPESWAAEAELALRAAQAASRHAQERRDSLQVVSIAAHDVKLEQDIECQRVAADLIRASRPTHTILGEEPGSDVEQSTHSWLIDPIDGTFNYSRGLPYWCTSVALRSAGHTVAGAVVAPELGLTFTATSTGPSSVNGRVLPPIATREPQFASLHISLSDAPEAGDFLSLAASRFQKIRLMGSIALDLCFVALGAADAMVALRAFPWDSEAGLLIAGRVGARTVVIDRPKGQVLLCGSAKLLTLLREFPFGVMPE